MDPAAPPTEEVHGYRIVREIGRGGFAVVYEAIQVAIDRPVALKVIQRDRVGEGLEPFRDECRTIGRLSWHPHVVAIFDAGETADGDPYMAMELMREGSLGDWIEEYGPLTAAETMRVGTEIADALAASHQAGVIHRDVKPDNIMVGRNGLTALGDFGIAKLADSTSGASAFVGSLSYAAPELFANEPPTEASDVYSLGATLYTLVTGEKAHPGRVDEPPLALMWRVLNDEPSPLPAGLPDRLVEAITAAMVKDPEQRCRTAAELRETLTGESARAGEHLRRPETGARAADGPGSPPRPVTPPSDLTVTLSSIAFPPAPTSPSTGAPPPPPPPPQPLSQAPPPPPQHAPAPPGPPPPSDPAPPASWPEPPFAPVTGGPTFAPSVPGQGPAVVAPVPGQDSERPTRSEEGEEHDPGRPGGAEADRVPRRRVALLVIGALALVAALASAVLLVGRDDGPDERAASGGPDPVTTPAGDESEESTPSTEPSAVETGSIGVGRAPFRLLASDDAVWVANRDGASVTRVDLPEGRAAGPFPVDANPFGMTEHEGSIWVATVGSRQVHRLDPATGAVLATVEAGTYPIGLTSGGGSIWVTDRDEDVVRRIDPETATVVATIPVAASPLNVAYGEGSLWIGHQVGATVTRVDPATESVVDTYDTGGALPYDIVIGHDSVWAIDIDDASLIRIGPTTGEVTMVDVGANPVGVAVDDDSVWVASIVEETVERIDPADLEVVEAIPLSASPASLAVAGGSLWVGHHEPGEEGTLLRLELS